ncbi:HET-domain-containing protein [Podospora australis]|uniref:HET-domain-containing protein n=1 Tax=Podospora australis TaxID=1536484 RepID=A0AAN6WKS7_9PEZI|nr:HET-domain-containing protein [Podospora australis]
MEPSQNPSSLVCQADWNTIFSPQAWETLFSADQYEYTTTWPAIQDGAKDGCNWCNLILIKSCTLGDVKVRVTRVKSDCTPHDKKLKVQVIGMEQGGSENSYLVYTTADDPATKHIAGRNRIIDLTTPESFKLAQGCMDNCLRNHKHCPQPDSMPILPDRVIDCSEPNHPRVVLTKGEQRGPYLALSYVWGAKQPMTTTDNIKEYTTNGIPVDILPQTIRDAISVTHSLGQRYLWIDALCIIQDSDDDRNEQVGKMRYIYLNSFLTLNAACASTTWEGFLSTPRPQRNPHARVPFRTASTEEVGVVCFARHRDTSAGDASRSYWDEMEPIAHRGWTLQEKLLPPRSLVYASDTLKYHCQTETVSIGQAVCEPSTGMRLPHNVYDPKDKGSGKWTAEDWRNARQAWLSIIFLYTFRNISRENDKLPAVGGVAEQFARVTGDEYYAGLWKKSLLFDLLWEIEGSVTEPKVRPENYRAPSWSWASMNGLVRASWKEGEAASVGENLRQAEVVDCQVTVPPKGTPFGELTSALLRLRAVLKQGVVVDGDGRAGTVMVVGRDGEKKKIGAVRFDADEPRSEELAVVPIMWDAEGSFVWGLVLERLPAEQFKRVGKFQNNWKEKQVDWIDGLEAKVISII